MLTIMYFMALLAFFLATQARFRNLQEQVDALKRGQGLLPPSVDDDENPPAPVPSGRLVKITDPGDTGFLLHERVDKALFEHANVAAVESGKLPAQSKPAWGGASEHPVRG